MSDRNSSGSVTATTATSINYCDRNEASLIVFISKALYFSNYTSIIITIIITNNNNNNNNNEIKSFLKTSFYFNFNFNFNLHLPCFELIIFVSRHTFLMTVY